MYVYRFTTTGGRATFFTGCKNKMFPLRNLYPSFSFKRKFIRFFYYIIYFFKLEVPGISRFEKVADFPLGDVSDLFDDRTKFSLYDGTPSADSKRVWYIDNFGYVKIGKGSVSRQLLENEYNGYIFHFDHALQRFLTVGERSLVRYDRDRLIVEAKGNSSLLSRAPSLRDFLNYFLALKQFSIQQEFNSRLLFAGLQLDLKEAHSLLKNRFSVDLDNDFLSNIIHDFDKEHITFCPAHGDFTLWNMVALRGVNEPKLIDLESFREQEFFGYDILYYHVATYAMLFQKFNKKKIYYNFVNDLSSLDVCDFYKSKRFFRLLCLRILFVRLNLAKNSIDFKQQDNFINLLVFLIKQDFSK